MPDRPNQLRTKVDAWNETNRIGTPVEYRSDNGSVVRTLRARGLGGHTAVIWLEGVTGCVDLDRVKPVKRERQDHKVTELKGRVRSLKQTLFMAAANCQGGSSEAGAHVAAALGVSPSQSEWRRRSGTDSTRMSCGHGEIGARRHEEPSQENDD